MREDKAIHKVTSGRGFYIGDICYVLPDRIYHGIWGDGHGYGDGLVEVPGGDGGENPAFAVAGTDSGDGLYEDGEGNEYPVDAGVIGIVPLEIATELAGRSGQTPGRIEECPGEAVFEAADGVFDITLPDGRGIRIDTACRGDDRHEDTD